MVEHTSPGKGTSRLLELLRRVGQEEPGTVGFGRPRQTAKRRAPLLLAAALSTASAEHLAAAREAGAAAAFVPLTPDTAATAPTGQDDALWPVCGLIGGSRLITPADLDQWTAAGIDSLALRPRGALAACFSPRRQGLLAVLDQQLPADGIRAMATLAVDGFLLDDAGQGDRLSGDDLLWLGLAGGVVRGPAIVLSQRVVAEDLEALLAAGVAGIAVQFGEGTAVGQVRSTLAELRSAVDALDPHLPRTRRERTGLGPVVIPPSSVAVEE
jgi:hypothetical protein